MSKLVLSIIYYIIIILTGGVDYSLGPYNVTFPAGVTRVSFVVGVTNDNVLEGDEKFSLVIDKSSLLDHVTVGNPNQVTVTIYDDDGKEITILRLYVVYILNNNT